MTDDSPRRGRAPKPKAAPGLGLLDILHGLQDDALDPQKSFEERKAAYAESQKTLTRVCATAPKEAAALIESQTTMIAIRFNLLDDEEGSNKAFKDWFRKIPKQ